MFLLHQGEAKSFFFKSKSASSGQLAPVEGLFASLTRLFAKLTKGGGHCGPNQYAQYLNQINL